MDGALKRPGRFDKQVYIGPPDAAARDDLFQHFMKDRPAAENIEFSDLVKRSEGYSNADIEAVVQEAAKIAVIQDAPKINEQHLKMALDSIPSSLGVSRKPQPKQIGFRALP